MKYAFMGVLIVLLACAGTSFALAQAPTAAPQTPAPAVLSPATEPVAVTTVAWRGRYYGPRGWYVGPRAWYRPRAWYGGYAYAPAPYTTYYGAPGYVAPAPAYGDYGPSGGVYIRGWRGGRVWVGF